MKTAHKNKAAYGKPSVRHPLSAVRFTGPYAAPFIGSNAVSVYRVLFFDDPEKTPHVSKVQFAGGPEAFKAAINHGMKLTETWGQAQVIEVVARISGNMVKKGVRHASH